MAEQEEDFSQLPLPDRFSHKNWKVRKEGYEEAAKEFAITPDESDPRFRPFIQDPGLWKSAASDSNVAAQQEGLAALCAFLKYGGQQAASRSRPTTIQPIYEKALISTRPGAKANALEALLLYVEIDKPDLVIEELLPALSHKLPKVLAATLAALTAIFHNFGIKVVEPKPVLKILPKVFGHADKNVRAEAQNLTVELYRWLKEAMKAVFWSELKPVQQQDLEKLFEKVKEEPSPKQERLTRAQEVKVAAAVNTHSGSSEMVEEEEEEPVEVDAFDLAEPVDAYSKIPNDFHENISSTKWKERKEALDALLAVLDTPRIKDGPYDEVVRSLAKCMKDANIAVVTVAANCIEKLATGLRKSFGKYRSSVMSPIMERLKEKKQSVADALGAALDAVFTATSLSDCLEETLTFLPNKNPNVKGETVKFLVRCLRNTRDVPSKAEQKLTADAATKLLTESTEAMRSGGAEILGTLMKIIGERAMGPYLDGLDEIRKTKIKEYFEVAEVKAKEKPKPIAPPPKAAPASAPGRKVLPGAKKPVAKKVPVAPPVAAPVEDPAPVPPKSAARALPKVGGLQKPGIGLKLGGLKKPGSSLASPQRRVMSPPVTEDDDEALPPSPSPSKFGMGRGGLAGRPLSRPAAAPPMSPTPTAPVATGLNVYERAELEELRAEKERLLNITEILRGSNAKLTAEIAELQNQNAQLIEDHTRDVLQIKAKETQLVRARGESDVLRAEVDSVRKENERYKREVSRLGRESIGRDRDELVRGRQQVNDHSQDNGIYEDGLRATYSPQPKGQRPGSAALQRADSVASAGSRPPPTYATLSPSEEKENNDRELNAAAMRRKISPPTSQHSFYNGGRMSPQRPGSGMSVNRDVSNNSNASNAETGTENWKRAAEVTSQLKARIEAMKASLDTINYGDYTNDSSGKTRADEAYALISQPSLSVTFDDLYDSYDSRSRWPEQASYDFRGGTLRSV